MRVEAVGVIVACLAWSVAAHADDDPPASSVGLAIARAPDYDGGARKRIEIMPVVDVNLRTGVGVFTLGGGSVSAYNTTPLAAWTGSDGPFSLGVFTDYDGGRRDDRSGSAFQSGSARLRGLGTLHGTLEFGLAAAYTFGVATTSFDVRKAPTGHGHGGTIADAGVDFALPVNARWLVEITPSITWASASTMQRYFGITTDQSMRSGFRSYATGSGIRTYGVNLSSTYAWTRTWALVGNLTYTHLGRRAADSPIVERDAALVPNLALVYRW